MQQPVNNGPKFDPVTGQPIQPAMQQPVNNGPKFDPVTGQPIQPAMQQGMQPGVQPGMPNMQRMQQPINGGMKFDPKTGKPIQPGMPAQSVNKSGNNKNLILGLVIAGILVLGVGGFALANSSSKKSTPVEEEPPVVEASIEATEEPVAEATIEEVEPATEATTAPEEEKKEEKKAVKSNTNVDSSDLFAFNFDGTDYQLPMPISDLIADGWEYNSDSDAEELLATSQKEFVYLNVPGDSSYNHVTVHVKNFSNNATPLGECYIVKIEFDDYTMDKLGKTVTVQNGAIKLSESKSPDVTAILGEADNVYESSLGGQSLTYYAEHDNYGLNSSLRFRFNEEDVLESIDIENNVEPEDFEQAEVSDEVPEYFALYVEPKELGNDPLSGNIQLDKKVYTLPCPFQKFLDNGWSYNVSDDTLGAGQRCIVPVSIGSDRVYLDAYNPLDHAVHLNNTIVVSVSVSVYSRTKLDFQVPGGLDITASDAEIKSFLESNKISNYEYKKDSKRYTIPLDQSEKPGNTRNYIKIDTNDDGQLNELEVQNYGWLLDY